MKDQINLISKRNLKERKNKFKNDQSFLKLKNAEE